MINDFKTGDFSISDGTHKDKLKRFYDYIERNLDKYINAVYELTYDFGYNSEFGKIYYDLGKDKSFCDRGLTFKSSIYNNMHVELKRLESMVKERGSIPTIEGRMQCLKDCINKYEIMS